MEATALAGATLCLAKAGLAAGTTTTLTIANNITFAINGKIYTKNAASNITTPTTDAATGAAFKPVPTNSASIFVIGVDSSGALKAVQGEVVAIDSAAGTIVIPPEFPVLPDTVCPIGYEIIVAGSTASANGWIFGSSNQASVTGITYTLVDVATLPNRPQIS